MPPYAVAASASVVLKNRLRDLGASRGLRPLVKAPYLRYLGSRVGDLMWVSIWYFVVNALAPGNAHTRGHLFLSNMSLRP